MFLEVAILALILLVIVFVGIGTGRLPLARLGRLGRLVSDRWNAGKSALTGDIHHLLDSDLPAEDQPMRLEALRLVAEDRGWSLERLDDEVVEGTDGDREVEVRTIDVSEGADVAYRSRIRVDLLKTNADSLDGLSGWDPRERWSTFLVEPARSAYQNAIFAGRLPGGVQQRLGLTLNWMRSASAHIYIANGALYFDYPEAIGYGPELSSIVNKTVEHAKALDRALESFTGDLAAEVHDRRGAMRLLADRFPKTAEAQRAGEKWITDSDSHVRCAAARVLGEAGWPTLRELSRCEGPAGSDALEALLAQRHPGDEVETLREALSVRDDRRRKIALKALIEVQDPRDVSRIASVDPEEDTHTTVMRAEALGRFDTNEAADALASMLGDSRRDVVSAAAFGLGQVGRPRNAVALREVLSGIDDEDLDLRATIEAGLWSILDRHDMDEDRDRGGLALCEGGNGGQLSLSDQGGSLAIVEASATSEDDAGDEN